MAGRLEGDLDLLRDAGREAGALAMSFFKQSPNAWSKEGGSPVTEADMAVDGFLKSRLIKARPDYGWLSEETVDSPARQDCETIFVVDPIDGTRGFIAGDDRWCVSLAVVSANRPVAAVLFAPARDELFAARQGGGAWLQGGRMAVAARSTLEGCRLAGPRGWLKSRALQGSKASIQGHVPSLAYRLASVASGAFDAAFASPRSCDWDLAACDLLVHEAGGRLTYLDGTTPLYNRDNVRHGALAAANPTLQPEFLALLRGVERERATTSVPT